MWSGGAGLPLGYYTFFTDERIYGQYQLCQMPRTAGWHR